MAEYTVLLLTQPEKYYRRVPLKVAKALEDCFGHLEKSPRQYPGRIKKLKGYEALYRYRAGRLRVVYEIHEDKKEVSIVAILPRGDIYKKI